MNQSPRSVEPTSGGGSGGRPRGQSDVLAIVLLLGMVFLGAAAVVVTGGFLVESVQEDSEHQVAESTADQTHQLISEAATSGEARQLPTVDGNAVDTEFTDGGSITLAMTDDGSSCGAHAPVSANLGAIQYDTGDRTVIYEGGAIWERSESGYSIRRAPGIDYAGENAQLSLTVIGGTTTNDQGERIVSPDAARSQQFNQNLSEMILDCRLASGDNTDLSVTVDSEHADAWERYFAESVAAGNGNVDVTRVDDTTVSLMIDDLSDPVDFSEWMVVHEWERHGSDARIENGNEGLNVSVRLRNTGPVPTNGTVTLDVEGGPSTSTTVDNLAPGQLERIDLQLSPSQLSSTLAPGDVYDYNVNVTPTAADQWTFGSNSTVGHSFFFGEPEDVFEVMNVGHTINEDTVEIDGLIGNIGVEEGEQDVQLTLEHVPTGTDVTPGGGMDTVATNLSANETGNLNWVLNRSTIASGVYEYTISTEDDSMTGTFNVSTFEGGGSDVTTGTAGTGTITVLGTEISAESLLDVEVPPSEREDATVERSDRGMFMPTLVADDDDWDADPVYHDDGGWVPAERVGGTLQPTNEAPDCGSGEPSTYETFSNGDFWYGWDVDDCWDDPDGFVWSDSGGYELEWAIASETFNYDTGYVSRTDSTWTLGGDGELEYEKNWAPVSAHVAVEHGGTTDRHYGWEPGDADSGENLNTYDTQELEWTQEIDLESGSRVTVVSRLWGCNDYDDEGTRNGDLGYEWRDFNCDDTGGVSNQVDASGGSDEEGVRVLTDGDEVPVLRAGYPDQRNATEVLNEGAANRINATTGELELGSNEAVFLIELTDANPDWEDAQTEDSYGDPNYNDVIVLFEYETNVQTITVDSSNGPGNNDGFDPGTPGGGASDDETGGAGSNIETDVTHVVIG
jgi:hypothetical protein